MRSILNKIRLSFSVFKWDIEFGMHARRSFAEGIKVFRSENGVHYVFGVFTLLVSDWQVECYAVCAACGSPDAREVSAGDEGWTVCPECCGIEQGYEYLNKRAFEARTA